MVGILKVAPFLGIAVIAVLSIGRFVAGGFNLTGIIAGTALLLMMIAVFSYYFLIYYDETLKSRKNQLMYWIFIYIGYIPSLFLINTSPYIMPLLLTPALITSMIHVRLGFVTNFVMMTVLLLATRMNLEVYMVYMIMGSFLCLTLPHAKDRRKVLYVALGNMLVFAVLNFTSWMMVTKEISIVAIDYKGILAAGLNGLLVVIISHGSEPVWEAIFRITSDARLIDLSNSNEPLLKRLIMETPGTYHHSINVANLAEKAAIATHCNYHLARVGALYHDIGKIEHPEYFTENQNGRNIHDQLSPDASAKYIIDHIDDGVELAKEYKLPKVIRDIIQQHQGDAVLAYFYQKAHDHSDGFDIDVNDFRYHGPKPQTKEAAIVMLADCVDAATKSINGDERSLENIAEMIDNVINTVFMNGQLDDCPLSFKELPVMKEAFMTVYNGMYHERVKYDRKMDMI